MRYLITFQAAVDRTVCTQLASSLRQAEAHFTAFAAQLQPYGGGRVTLTDRKNDADCVLKTRYVPTAQEALADVRRLLDRMVDATSEQEAVLKFTAELATAAAAPDGDPSYPMAWGTGAVEAAATVYAKRRVALMLHDGSTEAALPAVRRLVLSEARSPSRSTSPMSNLTQQCVTAAYARLLEHLENAQEQVDRIRPYLKGETDD